MANFIELFLADDGRIYVLFTCLTNNRVGADRCTGMYVREEDIFRAIYHQLQLFLDAHFISRSQYQTGKEALEQQIADYKDILAEPSERTQRYYEQLVMKEISQSEYLDLKKNVYEANERMNACVQSLEQHEQRYRQFVKMQRVQNKELLLTEILDCIGKITAHEGRTIAVARFPTL